MFFNPFDSGAMEVRTCMFEITLGDKIVKEEKMEAPLIFIQNEAINLINTLSKDERPFKVKFYTLQEINMEKFNESNKTITNSVEFANNTYKKAFPDEFKDE